MATTTRRAYSTCPPPPGGRSRRPARPARARPGRRAGPRDRRLGALAAHLRPREPLLDFYTAIGSASRSRGSRTSRSTAARCSSSTTRRTARRADDHAGDPHRASAAAAALHARRELVQGLSGRRHAGEQDRPGGRASGERAAPPPRRAAARARLPRGPEGSRKLYWQRYRLRRFGRGGFVRTAMRAGVPIVPTAVIGAEEAMPIFAHVPLLQRLTGLIYFPINHAFPHFGLAAGLMYLPAKFPDPLPRAGRPVAATGRTTRTTSRSSAASARIRRHPEGAGRPRTGA